MAVGDVYVLTLLQRYAGQVIMNNLAFDMKTASDPTSAIITPLATDWKDHFLPSQVGSLVYTGYVFQQVRGGTVSYTSKPCVRQGGLRFEGMVTGAVAGGATGEGMPPQAAIVTTLSSAFSGRSKRGRNYLAGFSETIQTEGVLSSTAMTNYQTLWNTQLAQYGASGTDPNFRLGIWSMRIATGCVPSKSAGGGMVVNTPPDPNAAYVNVNAATPRSIVYSQRRRTIGVGR